jgi:hypothetical protein
MKVSDVFPTEITFWTVLWYIFLFYLIAYIVFHAYIYVYDLEYEIDCTKNDRCMKIEKKKASVDAGAEPPAIE